MSAAGNGRKGRGALVALVVMLAAGLLAQASQAAIGEQAQRRFLDPSFGSGGKVDLVPRRGIFFGTDIAKQDDGRLVVAGSFSRGNRNRFLLARFLRNGAADRSFGGNGRVKIGFGGASGTIQGEAVAIQGDGRIVVAGEAGGQIALARLLADGALDRSFGEDGRAQTAFPGGSAGAQSIAIQADGAIVAAGTVEVPDGQSESVSFALARYLPDGRLDRSFGSAGTVSTGFGVPGEDLADANVVLVQPDGAIVAGGTLNNPFGGGGAFALARYAADGSLDPSFNGSGKVTTVVGNEGGIVDMYLDDDGRLLSAGTNAVPSSPGLRSFFTLIRYLPDGSLDDSWGKDGIKTTGFAGSDGPYATAIAAIGGGRSFVAGQIDATPSGQQFGLATYESDGALDPGFGVGGRARTRFGNRSPSDLPGGIVVQAGKPVVAGASAKGIALARYLRP